MLEDEKVHKLKKKAILEGYHNFGKDQLLYLASKSINPHEQETIRLIYLLKQQEEMIEETKRLAKRTWWVAFGTWFLVVMTGLLVYVTKR